jgi:hypothetical protein
MIVNIKDGSWRSSRPEKSSGNPKVKLEASDTFAPVATVRSNV